MRGHEASRARVGALPPQPSCFACATADAFDGEYLSVEDDGTSADTRFSSATKQAALNHLHENNSYRAQYAQHGQHGQSVASPADKMTVLILSSPTAEGRARREAARRAWARSTRAEVCAEA